MIFQGKNYISDMEIVNEIKEMLREDPRDDIFYHFEDERDSFIVWKKDGMFTVCPVLCKEAV